MKYVELSFAVSPDGREALAAQLIGAGASGLEERDEALVVWLPPEEVEAFLLRLPRLTPTRLTRDEDEWRDAWKAHFKTRKVGVFVLVPSWEPYQAQAGEILLHFDPGRAFGTGGHASTRLCLQLLSDHAACGRFADIGCGSGILAIACALRFPAASGVGIDIDAESIEVSRENAQRNHTDARIDFSTRGVERLQESFDLVFANIQPEVLIPMAPTLVSRVAPRGHLFLSGILVEAAPPVVVTYAGLGFTAARTAQEEGWVALDMTRTDV